MNAQTSTRFRRTPMLLAMMIIATGQVGVSIYLPSLPLISRDLQVDQASAQMLVTLFLLGFGGSQLFYGALSDAVGRRPTFLLGQGIYLLGTVLCVMMSDHFQALEFGRLLQGLGAGSASVLGRSVLRDSYDGFHLTKALSYLSITASIMPIIAPVLGGWLAYHLSWQSVFIFVLLYIGAIFTLGLMILPETLPYPKRRVQWRGIVINYAKLLTNQQVTSSASYNWLSYLVSLVTLSILPFLLQKQLGMTAADYGSTLIIPSSGLLLGSVLVNMLTSRFSVRQLLGCAISLMVFAGLWLLLTEFSVFNLIWAFTWLSIAQGISFPLATTLLLSPHKSQAGAVSALSGSIQMGIAGLLGGYLVEHWVTSQNAMGVFYILVGITMLSVLIATKKAHSQPSAAQVPM
ncbi:multidrug effflux MFS transporter [Vibrio cholerae]|uniref:multidrug effflux MFS transporter n=1 Tax=Vibrio cholerae TaxID=666 RepID=UPI0002734EBD|nr:multidrug effflux MFS transporter [Vibrio cholerae]EGQ8202245.1 multidrug effflux MFS transporter [Vibrio cholerae]EGQ9170412.1 multidrug effflux MFS transporter [Vibrio cholerae]EGR0516214.1 multidrug effflux MFS transporter [Vibrio cholerae]EGR0545179.1 multidrug effflux MFS transporter [Vibrio cholerae]EGR0569383.1 MFS transporter [Vibrio cholerae]